MIHEEVENLTGRNEFGILASLKRDGTPQKSINKQNLLLQKGVPQTKSLVRKHTGQEVCLGFYLQ
jgi:hypothetical protein